MITKFRDQAGSVGGWRAGKSSRKGKKENSEHSLSLSPFLPLSLWETHTHRGEEEKIQAEQRLWPGVTQWIVCCNKSCVFVLKFRNFRQKHDHVFCWQKYTWSCTFFVHKVTEKGDWKLLLKYLSSFFFQDLLLNHLLHRLRSRLTSWLNRIPTDFLEFICFQELVLLSAVSSQIEIPQDILLYYIIIQVQFHFFFECYNINMNKLTSLVKRMILSCNEHVL